MSFKNVKKKLNKKTKSIILPHLFGQPTDLKEIKNIDVPVIEDIAQSLGANYNSKKVGSFGTLSVCCFYATKLITCGEGGIVCSNFKKLLEIIRGLRKDKFNIYYNYKMTDFQAALGISQLKKLDEFILKRKKIARIYNEKLKNLAIKLPEIKRDNVFYRYVIKFKNKEEIIKKLSKEKIEVKSPVYNLSYELSKWNA